MDQDPSTQPLQEVPRATENKSSSLVVIVGIFSGLAVVAGLVSSVMLTLTLFGVGTNREQYAGAFVVTFTLTLFTAIAAFSFGKRPAAISPAVSSLLLAILSIVNLTAYIQSGGYAKYGGDGGLLGLFLLVSLLALPLPVIASIEIWQQRVTWRRTHLIASIGAVLLFAVLFVVPNHIAFERERSHARAISDENARQSAREDAVRDRQAVEREEVGIALEKAANQISDSIYEDAKLGKPAPESINAPEGYKVVEYFKGKYRVKFCIKPLNTNVYLAVISNFTTESRYDKGHPLTWYDTTDKGAASCAYIYDYQQEDL